MSNCRVLQSGVCKITQPFHYAGQYGYDYNHLGIDLVDFSQGYNALGYITAHSDGTVVAIETGYTGQFLDGSYGNYVMLQHDNGMKTVYAHLAYNTVQVYYGQRVKAGQVLAYMDNTGQSFGGHLHFEIRNSANAQIDPAPYLDADLPGLSSKKWIQHWHLYDKDGNMLTGWQEVKGHWYYLDANGIMRTGWLWDYGYSGWFLLAATGEMLTGWQHVNGSWYYLYPETTNSTVKGMMATGWLKDQGHWYYLDPGSGEMYTGTHVIDGKTYSFDSDGALIE